MADRSISYEFRGNFTNLTAGLATASRSVADFGGKLTALDANGAKMRAGLTTLGSTAGKIGLVAAAGVGAVVVSAAKFDSAMSNIAATGQEAKDSIDQLRQAAIKAGADTAFSAGEAAAGIENLLKAGVSVADVLGGGLDGALNLAAAGQLEVGDAAEIAASAMTQFKLAGSDVGHIADLLAAGAGKAQGDVSDLGMALKQSGLVAAQTGLSIEETTGALAAFASAGLLGSDAGTSFKTFLQSLTPSSVAARNAMDDMGFSAYDATGKFKGIVEVAAELREGLSTMTVEQQNATLKTIFGSDAVRAASVIYQQGADGIQGWIDKTNDAGYAAEVAATRLDNLGGDLEALKGSIETLFIGAGEGAQSPLRKLAQDATAFVNALNAIPGPIKSTAVELLAITAVTGGALWFGSKVINGIADTRRALQDLGLQAKISEASLSGVARGALKMAAPVAGMAIASGALGDGFELTNTASLGLMGTLLGPWGAAVGTSIGLMKDAAKANNNVQASFEGVNAAIMAGSLSTASGQFADLTQQAIEFKTTYGSIDWFGSPTKAPAQAKNWIEGVLGDSDVEEQAAQIDVARSKIEGLTEATVALAAAFDISIGPVDGSAASYEELDGVLTQMSAPMKAARITADELTAAYALQAPETSALGRLQAQLTLSSLGTSDSYGTMIGKIRDASKASADSAGDASAAAAGSDMMADAAKRAAQANRDEAKAIGRAITQMRNKAGVAATAFDDETRWGEAVQAANKAVEKGATGLDQFTKKGRENRGTISDIINGWNSMSGAVKNNEDRYENARRILTKTLESMKAGPATIKRALAALEIPAKKVIDVEVKKNKAEADVRNVRRSLDDLNDSGHDLDQLTINPDVSLNDRKLLAGIAGGKEKLLDLQALHIRPSVEIDNGPLFNGIAAANAALNGIQDEIVNINVVRHMGQVAGSADGSTVPKTGRPYADRHLYMLADGEEVISNRNGQADRNRPLLKAINAGHRLAAGGTASDYGSNLSTAWPQWNMLSSNPREAAQALKVLTAALKATTDTLDKERQARSAVISQVVSNFTSDPFAASTASSDIFGAGATAGGVIDPLSALRNDISNARAYQKAIKALRKRGLDGKALGEVDTLAEAQALQGYSKKELAQYERLYGTRSQVVRSAGATLADGVGATVAQLKKLEAEVRGLRNDVRIADKNNDRAHDRSANKIGDKINGAGNKAGRDSKGNKP